MDYKATYAEKRAKAIRDLRVLKNKRVVLYARGTSADQMRIEQQIFFLEIKWNL